jgi:high-affinity Fe2+/Pb2+ permease
MGVAFAAGKYIHWGVVSISLTNFLIIVGMIALFALALVLPFPGGSGRQKPDEDDS